MKQTVVGVFETSEEARRAHAVLIDAGFHEARVRMSTGSTSRGVDEGMAYPLSGARGTHGPDGHATRAATPSARASMEPGTQREGALERVTDFFKDLFGPESQREELQRYEEALRRGGALVAVDVDDEIEQQLAADILVRAGAYDLEDRAERWGRMPEDAASLKVRTVPDTARPTHPAAMPGNVTSMDPADPTGYRASRTDFATGETWPATRTAFQRSDPTSAGAGATAAGGHDPVRHEDLNRVPPGAGMASWDRLQGDFGTPGDFGTEHPMPGAQSMRDTESMRSMDPMLQPVEPLRGTAPLQPTEPMRAAQTMQGGAMQASQSMQRADELRDIQSMGRGDPMHAADSMRPAGPWHDEAPTTGNFGEERVQPQRVRPRTTSMPSEGGMPAASQGMGADPGAHGHMSAGSVPDLDTPIMRSRDLDRPTTQTEPVAGRAHMASDDSRMSDDEMVSNTEARHLLSSGAEVFLDDSGFARLRNGGRAQPIMQDAPTKIARNVRVYSRRADDPAVQRDACLNDDSFTHTGYDEAERRSLSQSSSDVGGRAARDRRMTDASLRARDCDDARETAPFMSHADEPTARDFALRDDTFSPDPASGDWAADWSERSAAQAAMRSPGPDDLEADRLGDEAAARSAASMREQGMSERSMSERGMSGRYADDLQTGRGAMRGEPRVEPMAEPLRDDSMRASGHRPTGADELARREAALREEALREEALNEHARMETLASHPEWHDSPDDPLARAAESARREAMLRDETLQDYASMDERAEMRAANAAAAARASGSPMAGQSAVGAGGYETRDPRDPHEQAMAREPLASRAGMRRTALDDGAPLAAASDDDDDRRYAAQDDADLGPDDVFVDTRGSDRRPERATADWRHMKQAVRNAWHRMTHPGRHH